MEHRIAKSGLAAVLLLGVLTRTCHRRLTQQPSPPVRQDRGGATTHEIPSRKDPPAASALLNLGQAESSNGSSGAGSATLAPENLPPGKEKPSQESPKIETQGAAQEPVPPHGGRTLPNDRGRQPPDPRKGIRSDPDDPGTKNSTPRESDDGQHPKLDAPDSEGTHQKPAGESGKPYTEHVNGGLPRQEPGSAAEGRWYWKDLWLVLLGAAVSLYTTVVFERYKRFGELMRTVARERQNFEGAAHSPAEAHLKRAHEKSMAFYRLLEKTVWSLDTDGQHKAAAAVGRLQTFIFQATVCVEKMLAKQTKGLTLDQYLSEYTIILAGVYREVFGRFEDHIKPEIAPLLRPYPHPVMRRSATAIPASYFDKLL